MSILPIKMNLYYIKVWHRTNKSEKIRSGNAPKVYKLFLELFGIEKWWKKNKLIGIYLVENTTWIFLNLIWCEFSQKIKKSKTATSKKKKMIITYLTSYRISYLLQWWDITNLVLSKMTATKPIFRGHNIFPVTYLQTPQINKSLLWAKIFLTKIDIMISKKADLIDLLLSFSG